MAKSDATPLTEVQREIMEIVWGRHEATVGEVWSVLSERRELARNTVQTLMVRLEEKGWLRHREEGRAFVYSAARPKSLSLGAKVAHMVDRFFAGAAEEMVTALIEYRGLSGEEAERIRKMIDQAETAALPNDGGKRSEKSATRLKKGDLQ